jgi:ferric-dicitrate binding protein FerR (iron transport regulator)
VENQSILKELYPKLVNGEINDQELAWLKAYFNTGETEEMYALIRTELNLSDEIGTPTSHERDVLARVHERIVAEKFDISKEINTPGVRRLWPRIGIAAAVATIIVSAGIWFLKNPSKENPVQQSAYLNDVAPGKVGATLTLANGKKIRLTDAASGELAKEAGVVITKTASGQLIYEVKGENTESDKINILTTDNGETYQVRLPDGSSVWLNAASTLKYPASFAKLKDRRVELSGEGYFEVAKDKAHPFIVKTAEQEVEVLGTHFNINSYNDQPTIATTLIEGSVKVRANGRGQIIKPNEQALTSDKGIKVQTVDVEEIVDWKEGDFYLNGVSLKNAMQKIARWYDVEVMFDPSVPDDIESTGYISRSNKLSAVLKLIEKSGDVKFKIKGNTVYVSK